MINSDVLQFEKCNTNNRDEVVICLYLSEE